MKKMRRIFALFLALIMAACVFPEVFVKSKCGCYQLENWFIQYQECRRWKSV